MSKVSEWKHLTPYTEEYCTVPWQHTTTYYLNCLSISQWEIPALEVLCHVIKIWQIMNTKVVKVQWQQEEEVMGAVYPKHTEEQVFPRWHTGSYKCWIVWRFVYGTTIAINKYINSTPVIKELGLWNNFNNFFFKYLKRANTFDLLNQEFPPILFSFKVRPRQTNQTYSASACYSTSFKLPCMILTKISIFKAKGSAF